MEVGGYCAWETRQPRPASPHSGPSPWPMGAEPWAAMRMSVTRCRRFAFASAVRVARRAARPAQRLHAALRRFRKLSGRETVPDSASGYPSSDGDGHSGAGCRRENPDLENCVGEAEAETRLPRLIPRGGFAYVRLDLGPEDDPPSHAPIRERTRDFISSIDNAEEGFCRWAAWRRSISASSAEESGDSSSSSARRMSIWRSSTERAGSSAKTSVKLMGDRYAICS